MTEPTTGFQEQEANEAFPTVANRDRKFLEGIWYMLRRWPFVPIIVLSLLVFAALFAPLLTDYDPIHPDLLEWNTPPFWTAEGSMEHPLGTDNIGRDVFSRLVYGARISLMVVTVATLSSMVLGAAAGMVAGYFGGHIDEVIMRAVDIWYAVPFIMVALVLVVVFGKSTNMMIILLLLLAWTGGVRNVRAEVLTIKEFDYVAAAKIAGAPTSRILIRHILPGVFNTILVIVTLRVGSLILAESTLSFLGAGIPAPQPAWGVMVADGRDFLRQAWWISTIPGLAIFFVVMAFNFLGDWLRDRLDPMLRQID